LTVEKKDASSDMVVERVDRRPFHVSRFTSDFQKDSYISSLACCIMAEVHVISLSPELGSNVIMEILLFSCSQPLWRHTT